MEEQKEVQQSQNEELDDSQEGQIISSKKARKRVYTKERIMISLNQKTGDVKKTCAVYLKQWFTTPEGKQKLEECQNELRQTLIQKDKEKEAPQKLSKSEKIHHILDREQYFEYDNLKNMVQQQQLENKQLKIKYKGKIEETKKQMQQEFESKIERTKRELEEKFQQQEEERQRKKQEKKAKQTPISDLTQKVERIANVLQQTQQQQRVQSIEKYVEEKYKKYNC